jgi:hypothetical protein
VWAKLRGVPWHGLDPGAVATGRGMARAVQQSKGQGGPVG